MDRVFNLDRMQEALSGGTVSVEEARKSRKKFKEGGNCGTISFWNAIMAPVPIRCNEDGNPLN